MFDEAHHHKQLAAKGWKKEHIHHAINIMRQAHRNKHPHIKILDNSVYWISLILAVLIHFGISLALIPALLTLQNFNLYFVIVTLGLAFGLLFELLIRTITYIERKHHIFLGIIIPVTAAFTYVTLITVTTRIESMFGLQFEYHPLLVSLVYTLSFILPYLAYHFVWKKVY